MGVWHTNIEVSPILAMQGAASPTESKQVITRYAIFQGTVAPEDWDTFQQVVTTHL
jgi:hypothetical protein